MSSVLTNTTACQFMSNSSFLQASLKLLQCPINSIARASFVNYSTLETGGSYLSKGFHIVGRINCAYALLNTVYKLDLTQSVVGKYCPALSSDRPRWSVREEDVRLWFLNTFALGPEDFSEEESLPIKSHLLEFREAFFKGTNNWDAGDARTLGVIQDKKPARLSTQCLYQLMPKSTDNITFIDPHFYTLWIKQRERWASGSSLVEQYPISRGNSNKVETLTVEKIALVIPKELFEKDFVVFPQVDFHKMGILGSPRDFNFETENSGLWALSVFEPKKQKITLLHPKYPEGLKSELFLSRFDEWKKCSSEFFSYIAKEHGMPQSSYQVERREISSVMEFADGAIAVLDIMHQIANRKSLALEFNEDYKKHLPLRRFQYAKYLVLKENVPISPDIKSSVASRLKLNPRKRV